MWGGRSWFVRESGAFSIYAQFGHDCIHFPKQHRQLLGHHLPDNIFVEDVVSVGQNVSESDNALMFADPYDKDRIEIARSADGLLLARIG